MNRKSVRKSWRVLVVNAKNSRVAVLNTFTTRAQARAWVKRTVRTTKTPQRRVRIERVGV